MRIMTPTVTWGEGQDLQTLKQAVALLLTTRRIPSSITARKL